MSPFAADDKSANQATGDNITFTESDNVTFTEQDLQQAISLAKFSYERLKTYVANNRKTKSIFTHSKLFCVHSQHGGEHFKFAYSIIKYELIVCTVLGEFANQLYNGVQQNCSNYSKSE